MGASSSSYPVGGFVVGPLFEGGGGFVGFVAPYDPPHGTTLLWFRGGPSWRAGEQL